MQSIDFITSEEPFRLVVVFGPRLRDRLFNSAHHFCQTCFCFSRFSSMKFDHFLPDFASKVGSEGTQYGQGPLRARRSREKVAALFVCFLTLPDFSVNISFHVGPFFSRCRGNGPACRISLNNPSGTLRSILAVGPVDGLRDS